MVTHVSDNSATTMERILFLICLLVLSLGTISPVESVIITQQYVNDIANGLQIFWTVDSNTMYFTKNKVHITLINNASESLTNQDWEIFFDTPMIVEPDELPEGEAILEKQGIKFRHVNGVHFGFSPLQSFIELKPGTQRKIKFHLSFWTVSRTDTFPNWFIVFKGFSPVVIQNTASETLDFVSNLDTPAKWKRANTDLLNPFTAQERFRRYHNEYKASNQENKISIIPKPLVEDSTPSETVEIDNTWVINTESSISAEAQYLKDQASLSVVVTNPTEKVIRLKVGDVIHPRTNENLLNEEAYKLEVNALTKIVIITGKSPTGVFNGIQSFLALYDMGKQLQTTTIVDQPRYHYRGMHIDVGRNFQSKAAILKLLDVMAMVKLNKLHFHLSDDEGWRLEIPGLPELTTFGSKRCYDTTQCLLPQLGSGPTQTTSGTGYYTTSDYQEILRHAAKRHIQVIPELDMPGHARAAIKAMEKRYETFLSQGRNADAEEYLLSDPDDKSEYRSFQAFNDNAVSPCINSTFKFLAHVMDEIVKLHSNIQPLKLYQFGGDEVGKGAWVNSSKCQDLSPNRTVVSEDIKEIFFRRVQQLTSDRNLSLGGWEDGMMKAGKPNNISGLTGDFYAYIWNNIWEWGGAAHAYNLANAGYKVIMCQATHLYFDHPYEPDPEERGYYWAPRFTNTKKTFSFMPADVYQNIDFTRFGAPLTKAGVCKGDDKLCPPLTKPENIIGMQGHLWSETVRTIDELEYMIFPRILAIGERAWHRADWESIGDKTERELQINMDWARFSKAVGLRQLLRLERLGINYRMSPPGAKVEDGKLVTNTEYDGQTVLFKVSDSWSVAKDGILVKDMNKPIQLKTRNQDGTRESRVIILHPMEPLPPVDQTIIDYIADNLGVEYKVIDNFFSSELYLAEYILTNTGKQTIHLGNWELYFYSEMMLEPTHIKENNRYELPGYNVFIEHVKGCVFKLTPTRKFGDFKPGDKRKFRLHARLWSVARSDAMPNMYAAAIGMTSKTIKSTESQSLSFVKGFTKINQWKRELKDEFDPFTPNYRYSINQKVTNDGESPDTVIPTPLEYIVEKDKSLILDSSGWKIVTNVKFNADANFLADALQEWIPKPAVILIKPSSKFISLVEADPEVMHNGNKSMSLEAYSLNIEPGSQKIEIRALSAAGAFYGVQSLLGVLRRSKNGKMYKTLIKDAPRFSYRGMHLDVGRNFHSNTSVLKLLDAMAMYKLNKFHFHLSDDEGWRLEIPGLEELTEIGSNRCDDVTEMTCILTQWGSGPDTSTSGSGHYSVADYKQILQYAADRHIEVIPEFDMPGHAHAAIKSMEARSQNLKDVGDFANADRYSLNDPEDKSTYLSIQLYNDNSINPCIDSTYNFVQHIAKQVSIMHQNINPLKTFHFGGDEVAEGSWLKSPACEGLGQQVAGSIANLKELFTRKISNLTNDLGLNLAGWEDGLKKKDNIPFDLNELANKKVYGYAWSNVWEWGAAPRAHIMANSGYKVVMAPATNYYFDHPYEPDPEETGIYWATRYTDTKKVFSFMPNNLYANAAIKVSGAPITKEEFCGEENKLCPELEKPENLVGIQGNLWSEKVRVPEVLDYMIFPRLVALSERAWHKANWETINDKNYRNEARDADWSRFSNALGYGELMALDKRGISYRVPPPGAMFKHNKMYANTEIPGLKIMMTTDGQQWSDVTPEGVEVEENIRIRLAAWSADGKRKSREISVVFKKSDISGSMSSFLSTSLITGPVILFNIIANNSWQTLL